MDRVRAPKLHEPIGRETDHIPYTSQGEPGCAGLHNDGADPKVTESEADNGTPSRAIPYTDVLVPRCDKIRTDSKLPRDKCSSMNIEALRRAS